ncbi:MAG: BA14K family protein [Hyphomicrobium sp.]
MHTLKSYAIATALAFAALAPVSASAAPAVMKPATVETSQRIDVAQRGFRNGNRNTFRGYRGDRRHYGYRRNRGIGPGAVIGGIVAGALIAGAIRESRAAGSDIDRCEASYRSFDRRTGTYVGYDGQTYVCPYLN